MGPSENEGIHEHFTPLFSMIFVAHSSAAALAMGRAEVSVGEQAVIMPPAGIN
jgi:hypothetical protein